MNKNKNGFTLVELIAVITIISLLLGVATPKLMENYREKRNKLYDATISEIERVAGLYLTDNPDIYTDISINGYVNIKVEKLCDDEYVVCPIKDPRDNGDIEGYVKVTYENNKYVYEFIRE